MFHVKCIFWKFLEQISIGDLSSSFFNYNAWNRYSCRDVFRTLSNIHVQRVLYQLNRYSSEYLFNSPVFITKSKLQTTKYCCQGLPFRCFWVLSWLLSIYVLSITITFILNSVTSFVYRHDNRKCCNYFNPPKPKEEIQRCCIACIYALKIPIYIHAYVYELFLWYQCYINKEISLSVY